MQLFVRGNTQHVINVAENDTVFQIKEQVSLAEGLKISEIKLYANGAPLEDETPVSRLETEDLELNVGLLGGKVHGSLARAGKVKGQTPKVEKAEKKKKKTGRAKRRFQYNRRFVNVVAGFGRKRGPNANPGS